MNTSENEQYVNRLLELLVMASGFYLLVHIYITCYDSFEYWRFRSVFTDRILLRLIHMRLFGSLDGGKGYILVVLILGQLARKGRRDEKFGNWVPLVYLLSGVFIFFGADLILVWPIDAGDVTCLYGAFVLIGFLLVMKGAGFLSRVIRLKFSGNIFNTDNEAFPQEERLLENEVSVHFPYWYRFERKLRRGWVNVIEPFRGLLIVGSPGSGKSWYLVKHIIRQQIWKGYAMLIYDFKYDDLSRLAYNCYLHAGEGYAVKPAFYMINFNDVCKSHRCNPLDPDSMTEIADAGEAARTILLGLNRDWISQQGNFWVESAVALMTALIWYLRKFAGGKYCTLPHVIELLQQDYGRLFSVLRAEPEIAGYINSFVSAYVNNVKEMLDSQVASLKVAVAKLGSPALYYIMSGDDFKLDLNNPLAPKICCLGNSAQRAGVYGPALSLYVTTVNRLANRKGGIKLGEVFDEFPTIYPHRINDVMATGRSNKIAITMAIQDLSQLKLNYGSEMADVIMNLPGNIIAGQVNGESAKVLAERIGKVMQPRTSYQMNQQDTSVSRSWQLESAVPMSRIVRLSAGEFVGLVADNPDEPIELKAFHGKFIQDNEALAAEEEGFHELPVIRTITDMELAEHYLRIKQEVADLVDGEIKRMENNIELKDLLLIRNEKSQSIRHDQHPGKFEHGG